MKRPQCFEILDLDPSVSLQELKTAYRDLVNVWHPDRYAHNPRLQKKAEQKLRQLNAAFEEACRLIQGSPETKRPQSGTKKRFESRPAACPPCSDQTDTADTPREARIEGQAQHPGPAAWQATEALLQAIYLNRARREYRHGQGLQREEPPRAVENETPRRRRIGEVVASRGPRKTEREPASEDRGALWSAAESHLKVLASTRAAARRHAAEARARQRPHPQAGWRQLCRRRAKWAAAALGLLAAAGGLAWVYREPLGGWMVEIMRFWEGG